jgi:hypothetical protein
MTGRMWDQEQLRAAVHSNPWFRDSLGEPSIALFHYPSRYGATATAPSAIHVQNLVLDFKEREPRAMEFVAQLLTELFSARPIRLYLEQDAITPASRDWHLVHAPGHTQGKVSPIQSLSIAWPPGIVMGHCALERTESLANPSHIARADRQTQLRTIGFRSSGQEASRFILWDDVYTSGATSWACKQKIYLHSEGFALGGRTILGLYLAKTGGIANEFSIEMSEPAHPVRVAAISQYQARGQRDGRELAEENLLRQRLRAYRVARSMGLPADSVLDDSTLELLVAIRPSSLEALQEITAFGPERIAAWGEGILDALHPDASHDLSRTDQNA